MTTGVQVRVTKAKTYAAAVGATLTALAVALPVVNDALSDDRVDGGEIATLITAAITLAGTVYAVWRVPNRTQQNIKKPI